MMTLPCMMPNISVEALFLGRGKGANDKGIGCAVGLSFSELKSNIDISSS